MEEIINKVAASKLITIDLENLYPEGSRVVLDIKDWLYEGFVLREKDFRTRVKNHDWPQYSNTYVVLCCSSDAIIPGWASMLLTTALAPYAKKVVTGTTEDLETLLYAEIIDELDVSSYKDVPVIIKGCSNKPVPQNAYLLLIQKLQPVVKSIFYGEACSSVPLFKKK